MLAEVLEELLRLQRNGAVGELGLYFVEEKVDHVRNNPWTIPGVLMIVETFIISPQSKPSSEVTTSSS
jgi:hypothetical protein